MRPIWIVSAAALVMATPAVAQNWVEYGLNSTGTVVSYDPESVRRSGNIVRVWERRDHSRDRTRRERETKTLFRYDCAKETNAPLSEIVYDGRGGVIRSVTLRDYEVREEPIVPESLGQALFDILCAQN